MACGGSEAEDLVAKLVEQCRRAGYAQDLDPEEHARLIAEDVTRARRAREQALMVRVMSRDLLWPMPADV